MQVVLEKVGLPEKGHVELGLQRSLVYLNNPVFQRAPLQVPHGEFQLARIDFDELYAVFVPS